MPDDLVGDKLALAYFSGRHRGISVKPRKVLVAQGGGCPDGDRVGYEALLAKMAKGDDINPHLTTGAFDLEKQDLLLNEWNIYHLHLGTELHEKLPRFVKRTNNLAFVLFTNDEARVLGVHPHKPAPWTKVELLELLLKNWPDFMEQFRLKGITGEKLTDEQRKTLRKKNMNAALALDEGDAFMGPGGGITAAGTRWTDVRDMDYYAAVVLARETDFKAQVRSLAAENGVTLPTPITATMKIEDDEIVAYVQGTKMMRVGLGKLSGDQ